MILIVKRLLIEQISLNPLGVVFYYFSKAA
jgi:hypothetical protein